MTQEIQNVKFYCPLTEEILIGSTISITVNDIKYTGTVAGDTLPLNAGNDTAVVIKGFDVDGDSESVSIAHVTANAGFLTLNLTNSAASGNAIVTDSSFVNIKPIVNGSNLHRGAVITIDNSWRATLNRVYFSGNSTSSRGIVCMYSSGVLTVTGSTFYNNLSNNYSGGIHQYNASGKINVSGSTFTRNQGTTGGAFSSQETGEVIIRDSIFDRNLAASTTGGGAIAANKGTFEISGSTFSGNTANNTSSGGGAVFGNRYLNITSSEFSGNVANDRGGAIYLRTQYFVKCWFVSDNKLYYAVTEFYTRATAEAAAARTKADMSGLYTAEDSSAAKTAAETKGEITTISELTAGSVLFSKNLAQSNYGGALWLGSTANITGATFSGNTACNGGAIYFAGTSLEQLQLENAEFTENKAVSSNSSFGNGGAVYMDTGAATLKNIFFSNNTATKGGALYVADNAQLTLNGATFATAADTVYAAGSLTLQGKLEFNGDIVKGGNGIVTVAENAELTFAAPVSVATLAFSIAESNNIFLVNNSGVNFTNQDLTGVTLSFDASKVAGNFAVTGVTQMGTLTVNGKTVGENGERFQNGNKYFITSLTGDGFAVKQYGIQVNALTDNADDTLTGFGEAFAEAKTAKLTDIAFADSIFTGNTAGISGFSGILDGGNNLSIAAEDGKQVVFSGSGKDERFMTVNSANTLTLNNLCIEKYYFSAGNGGAIHNEGTLEINNVVFNGNTGGTWASSNGGVIDNLNSGSTVTIRNSRFDCNTFITNQSGTGGIISTRSGAVTTVEKSCFTGNSFTRHPDHAGSDGNANKKGRGSVFLVSNATLNISGSTFYGNGPDENKNVIYNAVSGSGKINISAATDEDGKKVYTVFDNNIGVIGGLAVNVTVSDTIFKNTRENWAVVAVENGAYSAYAELNGATFSNNAAGAINFSGATVTVSNSKFLTALDKITGKNSTAGKVTKITFKNDIELNASITGGGEVYAENARFTFNNTETITVNNITFSGTDNSVTFGGADVAFNGQKLAGVSMMIAGNISAGFTVSGISEMGTLTVNNKTVGADGVSFANENGTFTVKLSDTGFTVSQLTVAVNALTDNADDTLTGFGEAFAYAKAKKLTGITFAGSIFTENVANISSFSGGVLDGSNNLSIAAEDGKQVIFSGSDKNERFMTVNSANTLTLNNVSIKNFSSAAGNSGGAISSTGTLTVNGAIFAGNTAGDGSKNQYGGAIYAVGTLKVSDTLFAGNACNSASGMYGGGAVALDDCRAEFTGCTFTGNQTLTGSRGGAIFSDSANDVIVIKGSTFAENNDSGYSCVIYIREWGKLEISGLKNENGETLRNVFYGNKGGISGLKFNGFIHDALFKENNTKAAVEAKGELELKNVTFDGNAGAIKMFADADSGMYANVTVDSVQFKTATDTIHVVANTEITFKNDIELNASITGGGEVYAENARFTFNNTETITVNNITFSGTDNSMTFNGAKVNFAALSVEQVAITIDGALYSGSDTVVATGVTGKLGIDDKVNGGDALYLEIVGSDLVLKQNVIVADGTSGNLGKGDGKDVVVNIAVDATYGATVRAGSASGTDSVIKSTVTAGTFNNNLYGGGLVSAAKTDITVSGTTEVKQILYGGIFVKEKESATDLGESNLTVAGGTFNHNIVGGSRVDVNENALNVTHTTAKVSLTISGGTFAKTGTKTDPGVAVYSAGYVNGIGEGKTASTGYDYKVNENIVVINGGVEIKGAVYGGVFACQGGKAYVGNVSISVANAKVDRILGGGWAQTGGKSDVGTVSIAINSGAQVGIVYAGGGNAKVGNTEVFGKVDETIKDVTITVDGGDVGEIFMGGRYNKSVVTGAVVVTIESEADGTISRISGKNGYGVRLENAGRTELVVNSGLTVGMLDSVDKLTIAEGKTLTLGSAEFTGMDVCLELGTDGFDGESWDVLSGISLENLTQAEFFIGGSQLTFDDNGVYTGKDFKLELKDNKLTMLAKA